MNPKHPYINRSAEIKYSKTQRLFIYITGAIVILFLILSSPVHDRTDRDTFKKGKKLRVAVLNVICTDGKAQSSLYFRNNNNEVKHVNVNYHDCLKYKAGDSITVILNKESDWYLLDK